MYTYIYVAPILLEHLMGLHTLPKITNDRQTKCSCISKCDSNPEMSKLVAEPGCTSKVEKLYATVDTSVLSSNGKHNRRLLLELFWLGKLGPKFRKPTLCLGGGPHGVPGHIGISLATTSAIAATLTLHTRSSAQVPTLLFCGGRATSSWRRL